MSDSARRASGDPVPQAAEGQPVEEQPVEEQAPLPADQQQQEQERTQQQEQAALEATGDLPTAKETAEAAGAVKGQVFVTNPTTGELVEEGE